MRVEARPRATGTRRWGLAQLRFEDAGPSTHIAELAPVADQLIMKRAAQVPGSAAGADMVSAPAADQVGGRRLAGRSVAALPAALPAGNHP